MYVVMVSFIVARRQMHHIFILQCITVFVEVNNTSSVLFCSHICLTQHFINLRTMDTLYFTRRLCHAAEGGNVTETGHLLQLCLLHSLFHRHGDRGRYWQHRGRQSLDLHNSGGNVPLYCASWYGMKAWYSYFILGKSILIQARIFVLSVFRRKMLWYFDGLAIQDIHYIQ